VTAEQKLLGVALNCKWVFQMIILGQRDLADKNSAQSDVFTIVLPHSLLALKCWVGLTQFWVKYGQTQMCG